MEKVIVLTARELGYQVVKALAAEGIGSIVIYGHEPDEIAQFSKHVVETHEIPGYFDRQGVLTDFLLERKREWKGTLIIPTDDYGIKFLAANREKLSAHYVIPTPDLDVVDTIVDKRSLYAVARRIGIAVPAIHSPGSMEDLRSLEGVLTFPCLLKPGLAHLFIREFGVKMFEVHSFTDLTRRYRELTKDFTSDRFELMICDIIPGPDSRQMVQYVSYMDRSGEVLASMTSRKLRQDPPRYGQGRVAISEKVDGVDEISLRLLTELHYHGFSEIEWKYDPRDGAYKLIEINPRFIFYTGLCVACGINFPYIQYADLVLGRKIRIGSFKENVYWIHEYADALHTVLNHRLEDLSLRDYVRPYLGKKCFAIFDPRDFRPFLEQWKQHASNAIRRRSGGRTSPLGANGATS